VEPRDPSQSVREALDRIRYWERRREAEDAPPVQAGIRVRYKDEGAVGIVIDLLDGEEDRKKLVRRSGAMVSFDGRAAVPMFLWALQPADEGGQA
jgi:hypothetical protein